jgi:MFS family permease
MIGMGFVKNFGQLAGLRVILGLLEAGFFPSCVYLLSTWYTRCEHIPTSCPSLCHYLRRVDEVGKRYSVFYLVGSVASAFSGILAYGVSRPSSPPPPSFSLVLSVS